MRSFRESYLIIVCIAGSLFTAGHLTYSIHIAKKRQRAAYAGDVAAAKRIILPCFKPLVRGLLLFHLLFTAALGLTFINSRVNVHRIIEYYCFSLLTTYCITPVMLTQTSVSNITFRRTVRTMVPYWLLSTCFFGFADIHYDVGVVFNALFVVSAALPPLFLSAAILTKRVYSRVQIGSNSNRNATEILLVYALAFGVLFMAGVVLPGAVEMIDAAAVATTLILNQLFPFALYRTLLADTKFWRGLGKHNQGGLRLADGLAARTTLARPTMEFTVASTSLQSVMADNNDITIDFAFLALDREVGQGASARVFQGRYKKQIVAVKLSSPPEIQEAELDTFVHEARLSSIFKHVNIVRFLGICVRPPQIGMCFEFCEGGGLKQHLATNPTLWPAAARLKACLHAARGVAYLHSLGYMHRDVKPDNFFVGRRLVVKLGDFGEAARIPHRSTSLAAEAMESGDESRHSFNSKFNHNRHDEEQGDIERGGGSHRMTILGTVAFMAPELVDNASRYDEKIDIYALGVTWWEILTGQEPYAALSTFQIYDLIRQGRRLELPDSIPPGVQQIVEAAWATDPAERPTAAQLETMIEVQLRVLHGLGDISSSQEATPRSNNNSRHPSRAGDDIPTGRPSSFPPRLIDNHELEQEEIDEEEPRPSAVIRPIEQPQLNPLLSRGLAAIRSSVNSFQQQGRRPTTDMASSSSSSPVVANPISSTTRENSKRQSTEDVFQALSSPLSISTAASAAVTLSPLQPAVIVIIEQEMKEQPRPPSSPELEASHGSCSSEGESSDNNNINSDSPQLHDKR